MTIIQIEAGVHQILIKLKSKSDSNRNVDDCMKPAIEVESFGTLNTSNKSSGQDLKNKMGGSWHR